MEPTPRAPQEGSMPPPLTDPTPNPHEMGWSKKNKTFMEGGKTRPFDRLPQQPLLPLPTSSSNAFVPPGFLSTYAAPGTFPGTYMPQVNPPIPGTAGYQAPPSLEGSLALGTTLATPQRQQQMQAAQQQQVPSSLSGSEAEAMMEGVLLNGQQETVQELVSQLMGPDSIIERQQDSSSGSSSSNGRAVLEKVLHRYEDKERQVESLTKRVEELDGRLHAERTAARLITVDAAQEGEEDTTDSLKRRVRDVTSMKNLLAKELKDAKDMLIYKASEQFPDVIPVRVVGEVTSIEIQRALTGYVSKKTFEEAGYVVESALRDPAIDPFQRLNGAIVAEDLDHKCLAPIVAKFGKKLARLIVTKKREMEVYCSKDTPSPTPLLWDHNRELRLVEVLDRVIGALHAARTANLPPVATTSSGRRVILNPRLVSSGDLGIVTAPAPPLQQQAGGGGGGAGVSGGPPAGAQALAPPAAYGGGGGGAMRPLANKGKQVAGQGTTVNSSSSTTPVNSATSKRPRAPHVLAPVVRHAFTRYMKQNSSMNDASVSMFSGAANSLIYRVLVKKYGTQEAAHKNLSFNVLRELMQSEMTMFLTEIKGSYANLPRIWKLLQGFVNHVKPESIEEGQLDDVVGGVALTTLEGDDPGVEDYDEEIDFVPDVSGKMDVISSDALSRPVAAGLLLELKPPSSSPSQSLPPKPVEPAWQPLPEDSDDDINDDIDCKGIIFGLPPKPVRRPRQAAARGRGPRGLMGGRGPRKSAPGMLSEEILRGFLGWMKSNTANRGDSLTTIQRAVNTFLARTLPVLTGEELSSLQYISLTQLFGMVEALQLELATAVIQGTNNSLRTFWRHFLSFMRDAVSAGLDGYVALASDLVPASGTQRRGNQNAEAGAAPSEGDAAPAAGADPAATTTTATTTASTSTATAAAGGGEGGGGGEAVVPAAASTAVTAATGGGGGEVGGSAGVTGNGGAGPVVTGGGGGEGGLGLMALMGTGQKGKKKGKKRGISKTKPQSSFVTGENKKGGGGAANGQGKRKGSSPSVLSLEAREGFYAWMQVNTRMQAVSMVTALRTSNRVVATMLERLKGPRAVKELSMAELREFVQNNSADFMREVYRTANVSVKTFWRHFVRFCLGEDAVLLFNEDVYGPPAIHQHQYQQLPPPPPPPEPQQPLRKRFKFTMGGQPMSAISIPVAAGAVTPGHTTLMTNKIPPAAATAVQGGGGGQMLPPEVPGSSSTTTLMPPSSPAVLPVTGMVVGHDVVVDNDDMMMIDDDDGGLKTGEGPDEEWLQGATLDGQASEDEADEEEEDEDDEEDLSPEWAAEFMPPPSMPPSNGEETVMQENHQHVEEDTMSSTYVVDMNLLKRFEHWLCTSCFLTPATAMTYCRDVAQLSTSLAVADPNHKKDPGASSKPQLKDATTALAFLAKHRDNQLIVTNDRVFRRFQEFLAQQAQ